MKVMGGTSRLISVLTQWSSEISHSRAIVITVIFAGIISGFCNTALIAVINAALYGDAYSPAFLVSAFIGLCIAIPASGFASQALLMRLTAQASRDIRSKMSNQILSAPLRFLEEVGSERLLTAFAEDIPAVTNAISVLPALFAQSAIIAGSLIYLGWLSPLLLLSVVIYMAVGVVIYNFPLAKSRAYFRLLREELDAMFKALRGVTEGTKELKLHRLRRYEYISKCLNPIIASVQQYSIKANIISYAANHCGEALLFIFIGLILFGASTFPGMERKTLSGYTFAILYMSSPLAGILNLLPSLERADIAFQKIRELGLSLTARPADTGQPTSPAPITFGKQLELNGVSHSYRQEGGLREFILGPLYLSLKPGELIFLIGGNGSGKTTLAKLLSGLYAPESGEILVDGKPITSSNRDEYRQLFSAIFADFYIFEKLFGIDASNLDLKLQNYLSALQLSHKVQIKNGAFSTVKLSQGQRKRLALLVAYLEDRSLYVFDEWAADQDPEYKEIFYYRILPDLKARGKTLIVISHDDRFYHLADRILKLENGQVKYDSRSASTSEKNCPASAPLAF